MKMNDIGINDTVVLYDDLYLGPARLWFTLKYFGMKNVYVLNGGFNNWFEEDRSFEDG